nr:hypothetical protein [Kofleriaceae bacterium]
MSRSKKKKTRKAAEQDALAAMAADAGVEITAGEDGEPAAETATAAETETAAGTETETAAGTE